MNEGDALKLVAAGAKIVAEGANMPSDPEAIKVYHDKVIQNMCQTSVRHQDH